MQQARHWPIRDVRTVTVGFPFEAGLGQGSQERGRLIADAILAGRYGLEPISAALYPSSPGATTSVIAS